MQEYKYAINKALKDEFLSHILDNFAFSYKENRQKVFQDIDLEQTIKNLSTLKEHSLNNLENLYNEFKTNAENKGATVLFARTAAEANSMILDIAREQNAYSIIKSKSMTSEEIELNHYLEEHKIKVYETDLGEWICQIRKEKPSHMVMPAIHLSRTQVASSFEKIDKVGDASDIGVLVKFARKKLRKYFNTAKLGITGSNFCIANTGTVAFATNEGNARLASTLPDTHIVLCGIDKLVPNVQAGLDILEVLPKNATNQYATSYVTFLSGINSNEEKGGNLKKRLYIIFLDNGRKKILANPDFKETLKCIRCGACANLCPVFRLVGGHRMGHIYVGAIGIILTYFFHNPKKAQMLANNCINCGACKNICSVGIDLPKMLEKIRQSGSQSVSSSLMAKTMRNRKLFHNLLKFASYAQKPLADAEYIRHLPSIFDSNIAIRTLPSIAKKAFRESFFELEQKVENPKFKVAIFAGCLQDFVYPDQLIKAVEFLNKHQVQVDFPLEQNCCALPLYSLNQVKIANDIENHNIQAFSKDYDYILSFCASCVSQIKFNYPKNNQLSDKIIDFASFITKVLRITSFAKTQKNVAYHASCHHNHKLHSAGYTRDILSQNSNYIHTNEEELCCGFGGTYTIKFPEISAKIIDKKLKSYKNINIDTLICDCPGCILQLKGAMHKNRLNIQVMHLTELF